MTTIYDAASRPVATQDQLGYRTTYIYNARGQESTIIYGDSQQTVTSSYDAGGNLSVRVAKNPFGDTQSTTSTYDEVGNPLVERAWTTVVRTFTYDALDRPVSMSGSLPWSSTMNWAYDAAGNMVTITEFGPHSFSFDLAGRIVKGNSYNGSDITHTV